ncbi:hypothetical protein BDZ85DRAFT_316149 [Elsinoe ampelina]|uniref:F-box domain-containing protein n=1 Tax=Elsinoe ampelina TaxID=302913 RepID=A0A6A6GLW4_9PEZI|nr:hypothetical protein BDZ85DRAFT_316149 [Elsinoe ampelina]
MEDTRSACAKFFNNPDLVRYLFLHIPLPALVCAIKVCKLWESTYRSSKAVQVTAWSSSCKAEDIWTIPPSMLRQHKPSGHHDASGTCPNARYIVGKANGICEDRYWIVRPPFRDFNDKARFLDLTGLIKEASQDPPNSNRSFLDAFIAQPPPIGLHTHFAHPGSKAGSFERHYAKKHVYHKRGIRLRHLLDTVEEYNRKLCAKAQELDVPAPNKSDSTLHMNNGMQRIRDVPCGCRITDIVYSDGTIAMHVIRMDQRRFHPFDEEKPESEVETNVARDDVSRGHLQEGEGGAAGSPLTTPDNSSDEEGNSSWDEELHEVLVADSDDSDHSDDSDDSDDSDGDDSD